MVSASTYGAGDDMRCSTPPSLHSAGPVDLRVMSTSHNETSNAIVFEYVQTPVVDMMIPTAGPTSGGTLVVLYFAYAQHMTGYIWFCAFGDLVVQASDVSSDSITCHSPVQSVGSVGVALSFNGVDFQSIEKDFRYYEDPSILSVSPFQAAITTATLVNISGSGFISDFHWYCRNGQTSTKAEWVSENILRCEIRFLLGPSTLYISGNNKDMSRGFQLEGFLPSRLVKSSKIIVPWNGATDIYLYGYGFNTLSSSAYVLIRSKSDTSLERFVPFKRLNDTTVTFTMPVLKELNDILSINLVSDSFLSNSLDIQVHESVYLRDAYPNFGPSSGGGTIRVSLQDSKIYNEIEYIARFYFDDYDTYVDVVPTVSVSSFLLQVPPAPAELSSVTLRSKIFVVTSSGYTSNSVNFHYNANTKWTHMEPSIVSEMGGVIKIYGTEIPQAGQFICRFDRRMSSVIDIDSRYISCQAPEHSQGQVIVEVSANNGSSWTSVDITLNYGAPFESIVVYPLSGPSLGGTNVSITGAIDIALTTNALILCRFGSLEVTSVVNGRGVSCLAPEVSAIGTVPVTLSLRHKEGRLSEAFETGYTYEYYEPEETLSISPIEGPASGGTSVTVTGTGFRDSPYLAVKLLSDDGVGYSLVSCIWLSDTQLKFQAPPNPNTSQPGFVYVSVTTNGVDFSDSNVLYYWQRSIVVESISPTSVFEQGEISINIYGLGFVPTFPNFLHCRFDGVFIVDAMFLSSSHVQCICPPSRQGSIHVELTQNGKDFVSAGYLKYFATPSISAITPQVGSWRGGTPVKVIVDRLEMDSIVDDTDAFITIGSSTVLSTRVSLTEFQFLSPTSKYDHTRVVSLSIQLGAFVLRSYNSSFTYTRDPIAISVDTTSGPVTGGTVLAITGSFDPDYLLSGCKCGDGAWSEIKFINSTFLVCHTTPVVSVGVFPIYLSYNNIDAHDTGLMFDFYSPIEIISAHPMIGSVEGGTKVKIRMQEQLIGTVLHSRFGMLPSQCSQKHSKVFECVSPATESGGRVELSFSLNGVDFSYSGIDFEYAQEAIIYDITPPLGAVMGGTPIVIYGENLDRYGPWYCTFGDIAVRVFEETSNLVRCLSPPSPDFAIRSVSVGLVQPPNASLVSGVLLSSAPFQDDAFHATGVLSFEYQQDLVLIAVTPLTLFATRDTDVVVTVEQLGSLAANLSCVWFRDVDRSDVPVEFTNAQRLNDTSVKCAGPIVLKIPGDVYLTLSTNGFLESQHQLVVTYIDEPVIESISPARLTKGSISHLTLSGTSFPESAIRHASECVFTGGIKVKIYYFITVMIFVHTCSNHILHI